MFWLSYEDKSIHLIADDVFNRTVCEHIIFHATIVTHLEVVHVLAAGLCLLGIRPGVGLDLAVGLDLVEVPDLVVALVL
jgi:hypothetical protein